MHAPSSLAPTPSTDARPLVPRASLGVQVSLRAAAALLAEYGGDGEDADED
jgi:hypothetical protein